MRTNPALSPAYYVEHIAFQDPPKNPLLREILPRIVAIIAPILFLCQTVAYALVTAVDLTLALLGCSSGILFQYALVHTSYSAKNLASSFFEIPEKLFFGPHRQPNYYGDSQRYARKDLSERVELI